MPISSAVRSPTYVGQDFRERLRGAAGRVFLQAMVHFHNLEIVAWTENFRRLARQPEERVHAGREVGRHHHRNVSTELGDLRAILRGMASRAYDRRLAMLGAQSRDCRRDGVRTEINHNIGTLHEGAQIVALIHLTNHFDLAMLRGAGDERLPHAAF